MTPMIRKPTIAIVLVLTVSAGCPGSLDKVPDSGATVPKKDGTAAKLDVGGGNKDSYVPPQDGNLMPPGDTVPWKYDKPPIPPDTQPWKFDKGYTGSPFGCASDSDCFGLKCCATPWGVKLCAVQCEW